MNPVWSPDGQWIAFHVTENVNSREADKIYIMTNDSLDARPITPGDRRNVSNSTIARGKKNQPDCQPLVQTATVPVGVLVGGSGHGRNGISGSSRRGGPMLQTTIMPCPSSQLSAPLP